jgi:hypothetical protein
MMRGLADFIYPRWYIGTLHGRASGRGRRSFAAAERKLDERCAEFERLCDSVGVFDPRPPFFVDLPDDMYGPAWSMTAAKLRSAVETGPHKDGCDALASALESRRVSTLAEFGQIAAE